MVKRGQCFQGSHAELPPNLKVKADRATSLGKCCGCRTRPTLPPWKMHRPGALFRFRGNFWTKMRVFDAFWKFPLPRELNPRLPLFCEGRDRLYQAPIAQFSNAPLATGREIT